MKKAFIVIATLLVALIALLLFNTFTFKSKQVAQAGAAPIEFPTDPAAVEHLSKAISIPTISYDDTTKMQGNGVFDSFLVFLQNSYPNVFNTLKDTIIGGRNILLKWEGTDASLKPAVLYAHIDVVPIEQNSLNQWKHGSFSGDVADGYIWGRGAIDDKGSLISIYEAIDRLVRAGFRPKRTIY
ncbi:MAG TPA: M20/M25/M40 family metallo-hydrolase, partial [Chitinophagales bacterium]|nr:M20/M25/M40 family metallo-hydrolase [Chitinophagales bacterium]